jgi:hypothetical protein
VRPLIRPRRRVRRSCMRSAKTHMEISQHNHTHAVQLGSWASFERAIRTVPSIGLPDLRRTDGVLLSCGPHGESSAETCTLTAEGRLRGRHVGLCVRFRFLNMFRVWLTAEGAKRVVLVDGVSTAAYRSSPRQHVPLKLQVALWWPIEPAFCNHVYIS